ncbi:hypothetical protein Sa5Y_VC00245 [Vibrio cholerae]|nr:hypothetical protein Sa5Y_VC00245 [Vibrio cholerae]
MKFDLKITVRFDVSEVIIAISGLLITLNQLNIL